jgi:hypothetical protein
MMVIHWGMVLLGFAFGVPASVLFFGGLAWGMQVALRSSRPGVVLLLSATCRIAILLAIGFWVVSVTDNAWSMAGYAAAFFLVRLIAIVWARPARLSIVPGQKGTS